MLVSDPLALKCSAIRRAMVESLGELMALLLELELERCLAKNWARVLVLAYCKLVVVAASKSCLVVELMQVESFPLVVVLLGFVAESSMVE